MAKAGNPAPDRVDYKKGWPAEVIEMWPLDRLTPYARNARTHPPEQVAQIAASITEFGWTIPVLADEGGVLIAGHGRVMAAQRLGLTHAPVMIARGWSEAKKRAYVLADNKLTLNGGWNFDLLKVEFEDLRAEGYDLAFTGFGSAEIDTILDGWSADFETIDREEENDDPLKAFIKVACAEMDADDVLARVREAVKDFPGVSVSKS